MRNAFALSDRHLKSWKHRVHRTPYGAATRGLARIEKRFDQAIARGECLELSNADYADLRSTCNKDGGDNNADYYKALFG